MIAVVAILASLSGPVVSSISKAGGMDRATTDLALTLEQARSFAMANSTYVWFALNQDEGSHQISYAVVAGVNGQRTDIQAPGSHQTISKVKTFDQTKLLTSNDAAPLAGMSSNVADITDSTLSNITVNLGGKNLVFQNLIQFSPAGEVAIGNGSQARWVQLGIGSAFGGDGNYAILQISGLSGQVRVFRP